MAQPLSSATCLRISSTKGENQRLSVSIRKENLRHVEAHVEPRMLLFLGYRLGLGIGLIPLLMFNEGPCKRQRLRRGDHPREPV